MNLGNTIKRVRKKKNIKQIELSNKCNISLTYLSQIENNKKEPALSTLREISNYLNIPLPILFFISLSEDDIPSEKREAYKFLYPSINNLITDIFVLE